MTNENPEIEPMTRTQVLIAMGVTAVILLIVAKVWLHFDSVPQLPLFWKPEFLLLGVGVGLSVTGLSVIVYKIWPAYRESADLYLRLVLKPLFFVDFIWLGLLPGLSEELLFRGVLLPAFGLNVLGLIVSSVCFGVLHFSGMERWPYVVWATAVGLVLGYTALETGSLLVPIVAHITINVVSSLTWKLGEEAKTG